MDCAPSPPNSTMLKVFSCLVLIGTLVVTAGAVENNVEALPVPLIGAHYFGGWYNCSAVEGQCFSHFQGYTPLGKQVDNWIPYYPERTPLLGSLTTHESTIAHEVTVADTALDFFDVLWYDGGAVCGHPDPNLAYCLDTSLAFMLNSTTIWDGIKRLHFFLTFSNDIDRSPNAKTHNMFAGPDGLELWKSYVGTWIGAMSHDHYLKINNRPVFKFLSGDIFLHWQCGGNVTLANNILAVFRQMAEAKGVGSPIFGVGSQNPMIPYKATAPLPHPQGYMVYNHTTIDCAHCDIGKVTPVNSFQQCSALCNGTDTCQAFTLSGWPNGSTYGCQLKSQAGPGSGMDNFSTFVRVVGFVSYDFSGTYNSAPPVCPGNVNWVCPKYVNSWMPNATATGAKIFPYEESAVFQDESRGNHSHDPIPYLPNVIAGFDPRPWEETAPSFTFPTESEWETALQNVKAAAMDPAGRFGFPDDSMANGVRPAVNIYAWNEFGEGGILAPTKGDQYMKIQTVARVFNISSTRSGKHTV